jgi:hypothetical protein
MEDDGEAEAILRSACLGQLTPGQFARLDEIRERYQSLLRPGPREAEPHHPRIEP